MYWPFSSSCDDDGCAPIDPNAPSTTGLLLSLGPFIITFATVFVFAGRQIFPRLARVHDARDGEDNVLPSHAPPSLRQAHAEHGRKSLRRRVAAATFNTTVALAAVLGELILCEIAGIVSPKARETGLRITVPTLLLLLVGVIPFLEIQSVISGLGWRFQRTSKGNLPRVAWGLQLAVFAGWLFSFWSLGVFVPLDSEPVATQMRTGAAAPGGWTRECLERIGVIGIALMAMLSGFAAASTPWYTLGGASERRKKPVTDADISRKQAGLDATSEMLLTKRHRLQALERKASTTQTQNSSGGIMGKMLGTIRGGGSEEAEMRGLRVEIAGLETMEASLSSNLGLMRSRHAASARASTAFGRMLTVPHYVFSLYCVYRILATTLTTIRRAYSPAAAFSSTDPINRFLGLLARHWDPMLDQDAWARQISFLLSGVILAASASSATQTFHLFARFAPGLLFQAQANLALITGQVSAVYVISAALLLRSNLPSEMGSAVSEALRSALDPRFVDGWFESWFLVASAVTAVGLWVNRKITGDGDDWDDYGGEEIGQKRS
ncbi:Abscisic acid G-protein coupled receptor-domain-containing protein [Plectosphaerella plurivora]|uniref:Abscisic acid G-protein coupled receptor-domain-containing protein n=1 Tax=Plectosphaerella plurivora TaxID=936078 RepID=A0A9P8UZ69_9PEZI|nr:Abscisic acid G-protein coupled receptor-domain-containing protein [Plectosphaerella plurivora]